ncbi:MAG: hypothetical protein ACYC3P_09310 [Bellilinea sp.]
MGFKWKIKRAALMLAVLLISAGCQSEAAPGLRKTSPVERIPVTGTPTNLPELPAPAITETPSQETPVDLAVPPVELVVPSLSVLVSTPTPTIEPLASPTATMRSFRPASATPPPPMAKMRITKPGPYSKLSSPIQMEALINSGDDGLVYVDLIGEDGRLMVSEVLDFRNYDAKNFYISLEIPFRINSAAELARLVVYTKDMFGQMISLVSVDVLLMQMGGSDLTAPEVALEPYRVDTPREGTLITGGTVSINGSARPVNNNPLIIELIDEKGAVVGSGSVQVSQPSDGITHVPFQVDVPYAVTHRVRVRLAIHQESATRIPGVVWMTSTILFLEP